MLVSIQLVEVAYTAGVAARNGGKETALSHRECHCHEKTNEGDDGTVFGDALAALVAPKIEQIRGNAVTHNQPAEEPTGFIPCCPRL